MDNMARRRRNSRRKGCRRNRRQSGGDGFGYTLGAPVGGPGQHIVNNFDGLTNRYPSCNEAVRPGYITGSGAEIKGGLPGFAGGRRRMRGGRGGAGGAELGHAFTSGATQELIQSGQAGGKRRRGRKGTRKQRGGRYSFVPDIVNGIGFMEPRYTGCGEGLAAVQNPLNQNANFPASVITAPPPQVPIPTPFGMKGGARKGSAVSRKQRGGVYGHEQQYASDAMVYEAPRSGYTHAPSNSAGGDAGTLADGKTPFLVNVPYSAMPAPSASCLKTGGSRKGRKSRKNRKNRSRKNRKASRKNRRN